MFLPGTASAGDLKRNAALQNLKHIIVVMQENHSFDNYFGALAYAPGGVYHAPHVANRGCSPDDHRCESLKIF
jgi:phospholipase C